VEPGVADGEAETLSVDAAVPPAGGVTLVGFKVAVRPDGRLDKTRSVGALKPPRLSAFTVA